MSNTPPYQKIQVRQGLKADIPTLDVGEPAFCTDTGEFALGSPTGNLFFSPSAGNSSIADWKPTGTESTPIVVDPLLGLASASYSREMIILKGQTGGGAQDVTSLTPIANGVRVGQEKLLLGMDNNDYPVFDSIGNLILNGPWKGDGKDALLIVWTGTMWREQSRR